MSDGQAKVEHWGDWEGTERYRGEGLDRERRYIRWGKLSTGGSTAQYEWRAESVQVEGPLPESPQEATAPPQPEPAPPSVRAGMLMDHISYFLDNGLSESAAIELGRDCERPGLQVTADQMAPPNPVPNPERELRQATYDVGDAFSRLATSHERYDWLVENYGEDFLPLEMEERVKGLALQEYTATLRKYLALCPITNVSDPRFEDPKVTPEQADEVQAQLAEDFPADEKPPHPARTVAETREEAQLQHIETIGSLLPYTAKLYIEQGGSPERASYAVHLLAPTEAYYLGRLESIERALHGLGDNDVSVKAAIRVAWDDHCERFNRPAPADVPRQPESEPPHRYSWEDRERYPGGLATEQELAPPIDSPAPKPSCVVTILRSPREGPSRYTWTAHRSGTLDKTEVPPIAVAGSLFDTFKQAEVQARAVLNGWKVTVVADNEIVEDLPEGV